MPGASAFFGVLQLAAALRWPIPFRDLVVYPTRYMSIAKRSFIASLIAIMFPLVACHAKCLMSRIEIRGSVAGKLPAGAKVSVSLIFRNGHKHPAAESINLDGASFDEYVVFSLQSRAGILSEWGEKCDRTLVEAVVRLVDGEGQEIDKVMLRVRGDMLQTADGFILRSPIILHGR